MTSTQQQTEILRMGEEIKTMEGVSTILTLFQLILFFIMNGSRARLRCSESKCMHMYPEGHEKTKRSYDG